MDGHAAALPQLKSRAARAFWWIAGRSAVDEGLRLVFFLALARLLTPDIFGAVALLGVLIAVAHLVVEQGMSRALVQRQALEPAHLNTVFWYQMAVGAAMYVVIALTAGLLTRLLGQPQLAAPLQVLALLLPLHALKSVPLALMERGLQGRPQALARLVGTVAAGALALWMAARGNGIWSLVAQQVLALALETLAIWALSTWRPNRVFSRGALKELFGFSTGLTGIMGLNMVRKQTDRLLIGLVLGPAALGLYSTAQRLIDLLTQVATMPLSTLAFPVFSRLQDDPHSLRTAYSRAMQTSTTFTFPACAGVIALAPHAVSHILGPQWAPLAPVLQVLALLGVFQSIFLVNVAVILGKGRSTERLKLNAILTVVTLLLAVAALPFGVLAVCAAVVIAGIGFLPLELREVGRLTGLRARDHWRNLWPATAASLGMLVALLLLHETAMAGWSRPRLIIASSVFGALLYAGLVALFNPGLLRWWLSLRGSRVSASARVAPPASSTSGRSDGAPVATQAANASSTGDGRRCVATPLRVAMIVEGFPVVSETFVINQIVALLDRGHDVHIYSLSGRPRDAGGVSRLAQQYGLIERTRYPPARPREVGRFGWAALRQFATLAIRRPTALRHVLSVRRYGRHALHLQLLALACRLLQDGGRDGVAYDVVHCQFGHLGSAALALYDAGLLRGALVTSFRGADISRVIHQRGPRVYERLFGRGDWFFTNCGHFERRLHRLGCPPERTEVLYSALNVRRLAFRPRGPVSGRPVRLITVGRLVEKKGVEFALRAIAQLVRAGRQIEYRIIGDGELRTSLQRLAIELGLRDVVKFEGAMEHSAVLAAMAEADIFLGPSVRASDGDEDGPINVAKESLALGLPSVATWHGGIPEVVQDGVSGYLAAERDVDALAAALARMLDEPWRWAAMALAGRQHLERSFDAAVLHERLVTIYRKAVQHARRGEPGTQPEEELACKKESPPAFLS